MAGKILITNSPNVEGPVVVLLGWGNGKMRHLIKFSNMFERQDFTTVCLTTPLVNFYLRPATLATRYRKKIFRSLQELTKDNQAREIFLMAFSQAGATVMTSMFEYFQSGDSKALNIVGTIYDSGPVMYGRSAVKSAQGAVWSSYRGSPSRLTRRVVDGAIKRLTEHQVSKNHFVKTFDSTNAEYVSLVPQLFLCSSADKLVDYNDVLDLSTVRRQRGVPVYIKIWNDCDHVQMFRKHPDEYEAVVNDFIKVCLGNNLQNFEFSRQKTDEQHWIVQLV